MHRLQEWRYVIPSFLGVCTSHKENVHIIVLPLHFEAAGSGAEGGVLTPSENIWLGFLWPLYVEYRNKWRLWFQGDILCYWPCKGVWMNEWILWGSGEWLFYLGSELRLCTLVAFEHDRHPSVSQNSELTSFVPFMCSFHLLGLRMGLTHGGIAAMTQQMILRTQTPKLWNESGFKYVRLIKKQSNATKLVAHPSGCCSSN